MMKILILAASLSPILLFAQNVGIGTPTPENRLHVVSLDSNAVKVENSNPLNNGVSSGLYFKTGNWFTGAIKQVGTTCNASR